MKNVVVTGSSRGIGLGLVKAFLSHGCHVIVSGSSEKSTSEAVKSLGENDGLARVFGIPCDVRNHKQVQALWDGAISKFGNVDIWVNNAGMSGPVLKIWKQTPETTDTVVGTNLLGVIYGSQVAINGMLNQGFGGIYNMEGMGSDGRMHDGLTLYGMTKYGQKYFNDALMKETMGTPIIIGALQPGMVVTDMIINQYRDRPEDWEGVKRIFNIIADRVEVVAPWLVDKIMENKKTGARINYTSRGKLLFRFLSTPFVKRDIFKDSGL